VRGMILAHLGVLAVGRASSLRWAVAVTSGWALAPARQGRHPSAFSGPSHAHCLLCFPLIKALVIVVGEEWLLVVTNSFLLVPG
jgi:hypothetical protein